MDFQDLDFSYNNSILHTHSDFKAETIAAALIHTGISAEHIIVRSIGTASRSYHKDVCDISVKQIHDVDYIFIDSPREGIYDTLPESIFHSFSSSLSKDNTIQVIDEIRRHREEEKDARTFFLPFEQEFFSIKHSLLEFEHRFENHGDSSLLIRIFTPYFEILKKLPANKGYLFIRLLPYIHDFRNDLQKTRDYLEILLDCWVEIKEEIRDKPNSSHKDFNLGAVNLGQNFILGNTIQDGTFDLSIGICKKNSEPFTYSAIQDLIECTHALCDYFFSAHYDVRVVYNPAMTELSSVLDGNDLLGISFVCS